MRGQGDVWGEMIGARRGNAGNPADGTALDVIFGNELAVSARLVEGMLHPMLDVKTNRNDGTEIIAPSFGMAQSGYTVADDFMYFKAGPFHKTTAPCRDGAMRTK